MWDCNIHNCVHDWRGNKLFHEQNMEICSCFSLYTSCWAIPPLPCPSPAGFTVSPPTVWLLSHPQVLLISLGPHCHLQNALKAYSISPGAALLPTFVGLASQEQCLVPPCLSALPGLSKELGLLWLLLQWGTSAMTLLGTDLEKTS